MIADPFSTTIPLIAPSVLSANFGILAAEINEVMSGGGDVLHLDVMDGHFVPNITIGPPVVKSIRMATKAFLDVHLMVSDPLRYGPIFVRECGADLINFHIEAVHDPAGTAKAFRHTGARVGVTLKPATPAEAIFPILDLVDLVLVMSVEPGFGGQRFMPAMLDKVTAIKRRMHSDQRIEIDGGIDSHTIRSAYEAGVDWFVAGSAIFGKVDRARAIADLKKPLAMKAAHRPECREDRPADM